MCYLYNINCKNPLPMAQTTVSKENIKLRFTNLEGVDGIRKQSVPMNIALKIPFCGMALNSQFKETNGIITIEQETTIKAVETYLSLKVGKNNPKISMENWIETAKFAHFMMDEEEFMEAYPPPEFDQSSMH